MALICVGSEKDNYGRNCSVYRDTDDLEQREYHYFRKAEAITGVHPKALVVSRKILNGELMADDIEENNRYSFLTDEASYTVLLLLANERKKGNYA